MLSEAPGPVLPLLDMTISGALACAAAAHSDREALIVSHQNVRLTWRQLDEAATRVATGLAGLGLAAGDRIGIWAVNCVEWVLLQYGAARAGIVLVNVNPAYRSHELRFVLRKSRIRALFLHAVDTRTNYRAILEECGPPEHVVWLGEPSWDEMLAAGRETPADPASPHDVANIQYPSAPPGHHRPPEGRAPPPSHPGQQRPDDRAGFARSGRRPPVRPRADVSLLRLCNRLDGVRRHGRGHDPPCPAVRPAHHSGSHRART